MLTGSAEGSSPPGTNDANLASGPAALVTVLMDSLLHDARNPLNALSINLEVLAERLRRESGGAVPPQHEKNIRTMREQVLRVDSILKQFADFIAPRNRPDESYDFSNIAQRALEVMGHESRKRRVPFKTVVSPAAVVGLRDMGVLAQLAILPLARALHRAPAGTEVNVSVRSEERRAVYRVEDQASGDVTTRFELDGSVRQRLEAAQVNLEIAGSVFEARIPLQ